MRAPLLDRVLARIDTDGPGGCWLWTGAISGAGYGVVGLGSRADGIGYVHRIILDLIVEPVPADLHVDHLCMVRSCCNPDHLEPVTQGENNRRAMRAKMRRRRRELAGVT